MIKFKEKVKFMIEIKVGVMLAYEGMLNFSPKIQARYAYKRYASEKNMYSSFLMH